MLTLLLLCTAVGTLRVTTAAPSPVTDDQSCEDCVTAFNALGVLFRDNATQELVEQRLHDLICARLGNVQKECDALVTTYTSQVINLLFSQSPYDVCHFLKLCGDDAGNKADKANLVRLLRSLRSFLAAEAGQCDLCMQLFRDLAVYAGDANVQTEINGFLVGTVCPLLGNASGDCQALVNEHLVKLMELVSSLPSQFVCSLLSFCSSTSAKPLRYVLPTATDVRKCQACKVTAAGVLAYLNDASFQGELTTMLVDDFCQRMKMTDCAPAMRTALRIVFALVRVVQPGEICQFLGFCQVSVSSPTPTKIIGRSEVDQAIDHLLGSAKRGDEVLRPASVIRMLQPASSSGLGDNCALCETVVNVVRSLLLNNKTESEIQAALENDVCPLFGQSAAECRALIDQYLPTIFELLQHDLDAETVCKFLGLCSGKQRAPIATATAIAASVNKPVKTDSTCEVCLVVAKIVQQQLDDGQTEQAIVSFLKTHVCSKFGASADDCNSFVDDYITAIIEKLASKIDPSAICAELGMCTKTAAVVEAELSAKTDACAMCQVLLGQVQILINNKMSEEAITAVIVAEVCPLFSSLSSECAAVARMYVPKIMQLLAKGVDPQSICRAVYLCPHLSRQESASSPESPSPIASDSRVGDNCALCKLLVRQVEAELLQNRTEQEVSDFLTQEVCPLLGSLQSQCVQLIQQNLPKIFSLLEQELSAETVCKLLGMCSQSVVKADVKSGNCELCKLLVSQVEAQIFNNKTEVEIADFLKEKVCPLISQLDKYCEAFVDQYLPVIFQLLDQDLSPEEVCKILRQCPSLSCKKTEPTLKATPRLGDNCALCQLIVGQVESALLNNKTEQEIEDLLKNDVCALVGSFQQQCDQIVDQYLPVIFSLIEQQFTADVICRYLKLCPHFSAPMKAVEKVGDNCALCQLVVRQVESAVLNNKTEQEIEDLLRNKVCPLLGQLQQACDQVVDQLPIIFALIQQKYPPETVCRVLKLCPHFSAPSKSVEKVGDNCALCQLIVGQVESALLNNKTEQEIEDLLKNDVCALVGSFQQQCDQIVDQYLPVIFSLIEQQFTADVICRYLKLCPHLSASSDEMAQMLAKVSSGVSNLDRGVYEGCAVMVADLKNLFSNPDAVETTTQLVTKYICPRIPVQKCADYVSEYVSLAVYILSTEIDPPSFCKQLGVCSSGNLFANMLQKLASLVSTNLHPSQRACEACSSALNQSVCSAMRLCASGVPRANDDDCTMCQAVVTEAFALIDNPNVQQQIGDQLKNLVCPLFGSYDSICDSLVQQSLPAVIKMLTEASPKAVCQSVQLCSSSANSQNGLLAPRTRGVKVDDVSESCRICNFVFSESVCRRSEFCNAERTKRVAYFRGRDALDCATCKTLATTVYDFLNNDAVQQAVVSAVAEECSKLPAQYASTCSQEVKLFGPQLITFIANNLLLPDPLCKELGFCTA